MKRLFRLPSLSNLPSLLSLGVVLCTACAAAPKQVQHYVLETTAQTSAQTSVQTSGKTAVPDKVNAALVVVGPVDLAEYLDQPSLVMQQGGHTFHVAQYHVWAEDLSRALTRALVHDLDQQASPYRFEDRADQHSETAARQIRLRIDQFHPTDQNQVVLAGQYWIYQKKQLLARRSFALQGDLQENGYPHAVARMRQIVRQLAAQLADALR
jgi:uncharacterized lipoprotein YmbA